MLRGTILAAPRSASMGGYVGTHVGDNLPQARTADTNQPAAAALAASVAAYEPELVDRVLTNAS